MASPSYHKEEIPDNYSERTYQNENTPYNIELRNLRNQIPDTQPTRPRAMEGGFYDPRYASINNVPPSGSDRTVKHAKRVYATMCCGSCCGLVAWIIGFLLVTAAFVALLVKVLNPSSDDMPVASSSSATAVPQTTLTTTESSPSAPTSTVTSSLLSTETTTWVSVSTFITVSITTETYTPPAPSIITVTSEEDGTILTSIITETEEPPETVIQTSPLTVTEIETTASPTTATATTTATSSATTTATTTATSTARNKDEDDEDDDDDDVKIHVTAAAYSTTVATINDRATTITFPASDDLAHLSSALAYHLSYIDQYSSTNAEIALPVAAAASTLSPIWSSVTDWCSQHMSSDAPIPIKSYCGPAQSPKSRRYQPEDPPTMTITDDLEGPTSTLTFTHVQQQNEPRAYADSITEDAQVRVRSTSTRAIMTTTKRSLTPRTSTAKTPKPTSTKPLTKQGSIKSSPTPPPPPPPPPTTTAPPPPPPETTPPKTSKKSTSSPVHMPWHDGQKRALPTATNAAPADPKTPTISAAKARSFNNPPIALTPSRLHRLLRRLDLSKWGVSSSTNPLHHGTSSIHLPPHVYDCVANTHTCIVLLSLIGVLCGIPFGAILYITLKFLIKCCIRRRKSKKDAERNRVWEGGRYAREAADWRRKAHGLGSNWLGKIAGGRAGGGGGGGWRKGRGRRGSGDTIEMGPDGKY